MKKILLISLSILIIIISILLYLFYKSFDSSHFNIEVIKSDVDFDNDGIDDYTDLMNGALKDALNRVKYKSAYYEFGYPPDDEGVCTDLIWRAFKEAGYNLKDMIDKDIKNNPSDYKDRADSNIDFRRVQNLKVFFDKYLLNLTLDINEIEKWQPGDIVIFKENHIGIISNKRNYRGIPFLIHNMGQFNRIDNTLKILNMKYPISGHYRLEIKDVYIW